MTSIGTNSSADTFNQAARETPKRKRRRVRPAPFSLRLSDEERKALQCEAGDRPLGGYIRSKLLTKDGSARQRAQTTPPIDYALLARILGALGKSELATSLCMMAVLAESGRLRVSEEVEVNLKAACADIREIRQSLVRALGVHSGEEA
ncbi:hypothetical protein T8K17_00040 [Thalassobaculum sp. OXR-137]|uniref:hypothetical protein n=1 Tax=Thalassobaculum sp. OXR-137 TaxID=3100173 RepID=UPI002AC94F54|nr:hypothetical protein [Thalassobaculum sp. OXR-137]WPZ34536.1 hypothetical protein T8K17_00040 [Thalassobaculum sp. OXR-137]